MNAFEDHTIENQISAQKRAELNLTAQREKAKRVVKRPPDGAGTRKEEFRSLLQSTLFIVAVTVVLLFARLNSWPTSIEGIWKAISVRLDDAAAFQGMGSSPNPTTVTTPEPATAAEISEDKEAESANSVALEQALSSQTQPGTAQQLVLVLEDDFSQPDFPLAYDNQVPKWNMGFLPSEGTYQIMVGPGYAAWSTIGLDIGVPFRVETTARIEPRSLEGYLGLLGRYQDENNFYLFSIDGEMQSQLLLRQEGEWITMNPWTPTYGINNVGAENRLAVEDDGFSLRFFVNDAPIHDIDPLLPPGEVGLVAGTRSADDSATAGSYFQGIKIYGAP